MSFTGVSLLDMACPRDGYRTAAAVATTYSADLIACLALLVALDGGSGDQLKYGKIESLRALERLRQKVRIIAQQGRVVWPKRGDARILGLLDSILHAVPFNGKEQSFHPKVLIARQSKPGNPDRYILAMGSRNLTTSTAWDFGIGMVGYSSRKRQSKTSQLKGIAGFLKELGALIEDPELGRRFHGIDDVHWQLPEGIDQAKFYFRAGSPCAIHDAQLISLPKRGRVLLISPFLDVSMVQHAAAHFRGADSIHLVSGKTDLDKIANSRARRLLGDADGLFKAYSMVLASDDAPAETSDNEDPELSDGDRGLHAKVFCVADQGRAISLIGSANLTSRAWLGKNWEAYIDLRGSVQVADELFEWVKTRAKPYKPTESVSPANEKDPIDSLRNDLAEIDMLVIDSSGSPSKVVSEKLGTLIARSGCTLDIARFTTPDSWVGWDISNTEINLPACGPDERTGLLLLKARIGKN